MFITFFARCSVLLLASLLASLGLLTNCKKVCDNEDAPTYALTQGESEWSKAFVKNDVWRFRNAKGYVRTYRVSRVETLSEGVGSGKSSFCAKYFIKFFVANLVCPATFGGRTYPAVLQGTYYSIAPPRTPSASLSPKLRASCASRSSAAPFGTGSGSGSRRRSTVSHAAHQSCRCPA